MDEQRTSANDEQILQMFVTEHTNLQTIRSGTIFESSGRTTLFLGALSSSVVALAFIGQTSEMGEAFLWFAIILLPPLFFLGLVTFFRVFQTGIQDMIAARGINRIRHYYTEVAPEMKGYFILSTHDDMDSVMKDMGASDAGWWQIFFSTHSLIGVVNSLLAALFFALVIGNFFEVQPAIAIISGVLVFGASIYLHYRYQSRTFTAINERLNVMFPSADDK